MAKSIEERIERVAAALVQEGTFFSRTAIEQAVSILIAGGLDVPFIPMGNLEKMERKLNSLKKEK